MFELATVDLTQILGDKNCVGIVPLAELSCGRRVVEGCKVKQYRHPLEYLGVVKLRGVIRIECRGGRGSS